MMSHRSRPARVAMAAAALTLAAPSTSLAADTVFGGSTTAGDPIALTADKKAAKLKSAVIAWVAPCDDGMQFPVSLQGDGRRVRAGLRRPDPRDLAVTRNAKGRFAGTQTGCARSRRAGRDRDHQARREAPARQGLRHAVRRCHRLRQGHRRAPLRLLGQRPLVRDELPGARVRRG